MYIHMFTYWFLVLLSADSFSSALLVRLMIRIRRIRRRMIFFKNFSRKGRISQQLSPEDPPKIVGHLGGQPRHRGLPRPWGLAQVGSLVGQGEQGEAKVLWLTKCLGKGYPFPYPRSWTKVPLVLLKTSYIKLFKEWDIEREPSSFRTSYYYKRMLDQCRVQEQNLKRDCVQFNPLNDALK